MQPGDAAEYEAGARAYFDSLRQAFEQTLASIRKDRPGLMLRITLFIFLFAVLDAAFLSIRVVQFVFHQTTYSFFGKTHEITATAGLNLLWCMIGLALFGGVLHSAAQQMELSRAVKLLSAKTMVFVLSYAIVRELDSFERTELPHHHRKAVEYWTKMLIYLRWCLQGRMSVDDVHFHSLPSADYPLAANAERFAKALNWDEVRKPEYDVAVVLNSVHSRISPRLETKLNLPSLRIVFQSLGNFFYTTVVQRREGEAVWGYGELLTAINIINGMPAMRKSAASKRVWVVSPTLLFAHSNIVVAVFAWWLAFQILIVVLVAAAFHFFPLMTMNSQAMVALIAAPIAAAISIVGITRKGS